jgi:hypothetical protein
MSGLYPALTALAALVEWCERERAIMENANLSIAAGKMTVRINENNKIADISKITITENIRRIESLDRILEDLTSQPNDASSEARRKIFRR